MGTNVKKFNLDLAREAKKFGEAGRAFFKKIVIEVARRAIFRTPVDTGRLRGGWQVSVNVPGDRLLEIKDKEGKVTEGQAIDAVTPLQLGDTAFITNNVEYALYIEEGTPKIKARKMLGLSIQEVSKGLGL